MDKKSILIKKELKIEPFIFKAKQKELPPYHHHNINQILFILKGDGSLILNNKKFPIKEFDIIILNKNDNHKFYPNSPNTMILYIIEFSDNFLNKYSINTELKKFLKSLSDKQKIISTNQPELLNIPLIIRKMMFEITHKYPNYLFILSIKLLEILSIIHRYITDKNSLKGSQVIKNKSEERVRLVIKYIDNHYYEKLSLLNLAKMANLSERQFTRLFRKLSNMSFKEYINNVRIEKSKFLLKTTDDEIISICFEVGFDDLSYFYKVFKQATGITPKSFRKKII